MVDEDMIFPRTRKRRWMTWPRPGMALEIALGPKADRFLQNAFLSFSPGVPPSAKIKKIAGSWKGGRSHPKSSRGDLHLGLRDQVPDLVAGLQDKHLADIVRVPVTEIP